MKSDKVKIFMQLAGQEVATDLNDGDPGKRVLGAQLLLSEVLEYIIKGLGVTPTIAGQRITDPEAIKYETHAENPDKIEVIDGLADVAYTMYWNALCFGVPLEEAFELVSDNNLEKFVKLGSGFKEGLLDPSKWDCGKGIKWPTEVQTVDVVKVGSDLYAVGKDARKKVRKPSSYKSVELEILI
ncbi:MAG: hypothetical protein SGJ02_08015 [bacterium]|nr:hypothetical protein [bacterium]